jgi:LCP family protein required for cell wall assembly
LGIGGENHEGGLMTDTILLASINFAKKDAVILHIPRDIWIPTFKDKINAAYQLGEEKASGSGMLLAKSAVEEIVGVPIHYGMLIDFSGFQKMIDAVGGIDVTVTETFTDTMYPIAGRENDLCNGDRLYKCRYESITFTKGTEHMNGTRALKYVRSRHAEGTEGNDFSRGKRQEAVLVAFKNKLLTKENFTNLQLLGKLQSISLQTIKTDMPIGDIVLAVKTIYDTTPNIRSYGLIQDEPEKGIAGLLINPPLWQYDGAWVLVPKHKDLTQIHAYTQCLLSAAANCPLPE